MKKLFAILVLLAAPLALSAQSYYPGTQTSLLPNYSYAAQSFTATAQTGQTINLAGVSSGLIQVTGTGLTTATWELEGSIDGGTTWFPIGTAPYTFTSGSLTLPVASVNQTETTTATSLYIANLAGLTNVRFVTSGTFTATSISIKLTTASNNGLL